MSESTERTLGSSQNQEDQHVDYYHQNTFGYSLSLSHFIPSLALPMVKLFIVWTGMSFKMIASLYK